MLTTVLVLLGLVGILNGLWFWVYNLVNWDGEKGCKPEDCDTCPFPRCKDRPTKDK